MAVAYVSDADKQDLGSQSSTAFTSFAVSGTNPVIVVMTVFRDPSGETVSSVVCSAGLTGTAALIIAQNSSGGNARVEIWAIPAPSGTGTITVTFSASVTHQTCAVLMQGADQTTPCPTGDAVSTAPGILSDVQLTANNLTANDAVVFMGGQTSTGDDPHVAVGTQIFYGNSTITNATAGYHLGTGLVQITWTGAAVSEVMAAVRVQQPQGGDALMAQGVM